MLLLTTTGHLVQLQAGTAGALDCHVSYVDNNSGAITPTAVDLASLTTTTLTTIVAAPSSGVQRNVKAIIINNNSVSVTTLVTVTHTDGTNIETLIVTNLAPSETLIMDETGGWSHYDANGNFYSVGLPVNTLGDILTYSTVPARLPVGANGTVLTADSNKPTGNKWVPPVLTSFSTSTVSAGYATDTYLAGSAIAMPDDGPIAGTLYHLVFDMVKTATGTAAFVVTLRYGTLGTTADASLIAFSFTAGSAAADSGTIELFALFRTVGTGTSAVVVGKAGLSHLLAATGLTSLGAAGWGQITTVSSGFNSAVAGSIMGVSVNGGTSFSGTNTITQAYALNLN